MRAARSLLAKRHSVWGLVVAGTWVCVSKGVGALGDASLTRAAGGATGWDDWRKAKCRQASKAAQRGDEVLSVRAFGEAELRHVPTVSTSYCTLVPLALRGEHINAPKLSPAWDQ